MPANVQTMAYVGQEPWHGLGTRVNRTVHAAEMIRAAGLDWEVAKQPGRGAKPVRVLSDGREIYSRYEIIRMPRPQLDEQEVVLGIVTDRYEPLQNTDAFEFFDPIVDRKAAFFETAGALGEGERVWIMAKMPDAMEIVRGDECLKYLLLSNTHTGQGSVIVKFTAVRVVCQNTLMLAMQDGQQAFRVRHSKNMTNRLQQVSELIAEASAVYSKAAEVFRMIAKISLRDKLVNKYLSMVFPKSKAQEQNGEEPPKWQHVKRLIDELPDLQPKPIHGTLWAAYNAVVRFEDYRVVMGEVEPARLDRVWFGRGADVKLKALNAAAELASNA